MADSWEASKGRTERNLRALNSQVPVGTLRGRFNAGRQVPGFQTGERMIVEEEAIIQALTEIFTDATQTNNYNFLAQSFFNSFATYIENHDNSTAIYNFIEEILQATTEYYDYSVTNNINASVLNNYASTLLNVITQYFETHTNETTQNFIANVIEEISYYIENNNNNITENFIENILQAINNYITNNPDGPGLGGFSVHVGPSAPATTKIGSLWFDTDESL